MRHDQHINEQDASHDHFAAKEYSALALRVTKIPAKCVGTREELFA